MALRSVSSAPLCGPRCRGRRPARAKLERLLPPAQTVFIGYLHGEELAYAYAAADVFVFPSANEIFSNVVLEAMASGLPVIAPRSGGVLDLVTERETGLLCNPDDQGDFVMAVRQLLTDWRYARQLGETGRQRASARSWAVVLDQLLAEYTSVIER